MFTSYTVVVQTIEDDSLCTFKYQFCKGQSHSTNQSIHTQDEYTTARTGNGPSSVFVLVNKEPDPSTTALYERPKDKRGAMGPIRTSRWWLIPRSRYYDTMIHDTIHACKCHDDYYSDQGLRLSICFLIQFIFHSFLPMIALLMPDTKTQKYCRPQS